IAPWVQTPFASTLLNRTPGRKGDPMGRGMGISPSFTTAGKPKYVTYGKPVASSATAEPSPTLSREAATAGTKRTPLPRLIEVVLDHDDRVARRDESLQHLEQLADVLEVQPRGGLVQHVERVARRPLVELRGQLDPLGLAAGEGRGGLAELDVAEPDVGERLHLSLDR